MQAIIYNLDQSQIFFSRKEYFIADIVRISIAWCLEMQTIFYSFLLFHAVIHCPPSTHTDLSQYPTFDVYHFFGKGPMGDRELEMADPV